MTRQEALDRIANSNGKIIGVKFIKRTTGEVRQMQCRLGVVRVRSDLGSGPAYNAEDHGLIRVWDMNRHGYRSVPKEGIIEICVDGEYQAIEEGE